MCGAKPSQAAVPRTLVTFGFDAAIHLWWVRQDILIILTPSWPIRKLKMMFFQNLRLTRVFPRDVVWYWSPVQTRKPQPSWPRPAQASAAWNSVSGWRWHLWPSSLSISTFSIWSVSRLAPTFLFLLKTRGIMIYVKVVIDTFFPVLIFDILALTSTFVSSQQYNFASSYVAGPGALKSLTLWICPYFELFL